VNVTSVSGRVAVSPQGAYTASKHALEALSEVLAQEVRRFGIRVHVVEPGVVLTPIFAKNMSEPDLGSPYADLAFRIGDMFMKRLQDPSPPELAAQVIDDAISAATPVLRHLVGWDAEHFVTGRASMSDETWVDYGLPMSDAELARYWRDHFKIATEAFTAIPDA
jgi:NAD(P)-dependent dehydrogenase (short-subunit alcohol dehydrogenase family)